jgi:hypothetical protein
VLVIRTARSTPAVSLLRRPISFISDYVKRAFSNFRIYITRTGETDRNVLEVQTHQAFVRKVSYFDFRAGHSLF